MKRRIIGLTGALVPENHGFRLPPAYHLPVLDADTYAREAVQLGSPVLKAITEHYGSDILLPDGTLNRTQLGQIVFSSLDERRWLEQQIHPYVRNTFSKALLGHRELSLQKYPSASTPSQWYWLCHCCLKLG